MGRTRTNIRNEVAKQLGLPFISGTSSASSATTLTDIALARYGTDELVGAYVYLLDATVPNRVITDNVQATGVLTFRPSSSAGMDGTDAYEILPFPADSIHDAINEAALTLFAEGVLSRELFTLAIAGSPIYNADMAYWTSSSALNGWTAASATLARNQTAGYQWMGPNAATLTTGTGTLTLAAPWLKYLADLAPGSVRVHAWVRGNTASQIRVQFMADGSAVASSGFHSGDGDYHVVSTDWYDVADAETDLSIRFDYADAATTAGISLVWVEGGNYPMFHPVPVSLFPKGPSTIYSAAVGLDTTNTRTVTVPRSARLEHGWSFVRMHEEALDVETGLIRWKHNRPTAGRLLYIGGRAPLTLPTTDAGVVEIARYEEVLLAKVAALNLLDQNLSTPTLATRERKARLARDIEMLVESQEDNADAVTLGPNW